MINIYGEILLDVLKTSNEIKANIGGAPFNVYYTICKLKGNATFVSNVGNDTYGKTIREYVENAGLSAKYITLDPDKDHKTTLAYVTLSDNGERDFKFIRDPGADSFMIEESKYLLDGDNEIVHIGSLMLSNEYGRKFAKDVISKTLKRNNKVSFDINYREDIFKDSKSAKKIYNEIIDKANIVKYSNDEVKMFSGLDDIYQGIKKIIRKNQKMFVTLGKDGSLFYDGKEFIEEKSIEVKPVDTTGAGDAFYATILNCIDKVGYDNFFNNKDYIHDALKRANIMGAYATLKVGAVSSILTLKELETKL